MKKKNLSKLYIKKLTISNLNKIKGGEADNGDQSYREECKSDKQECTSIASRTEFPIPDNGEYGGGD